MRYWTAASPPTLRVILVESAPRALTEAVILRLRGVLGAEVPFGLVTCHPGVPNALETFARIWRTQDYKTDPSRARLLTEIAESAPTVLAIVCAGNPIMERWKWWLVWKLPAKVLVINENTDCFWLDTGNLRNVMRLVSARLGLSHAFPAQTILRCAALPFVFGYLSLYAAAVHTRRAVRLVLTRRV